MRGKRPQHIAAISYIVEVMIASVLSICIFWSHVRRRIIGQVDTDELDREKTRAE